MKAIKTAALPLVTALVMACGGDKKAPPPERIVEETDPVTGIISLRDYTLSDTITIAGKLYNYTYSLQHDDSLPVLINPQGLEYHESWVKINIKRGDTEVFNKIFQKTNFKEYVPADFLKTSTMVGVTYNFNKRDEDRSAFYFIVTVGDPDETSDMVCPLELKVATDGSYSLKKAENLETGPLTQGLNIEPPEE